MKRLLLISSVICLWMGMVFFSCSDGGSKAKNVADNPDTTCKNRAAAGNTASSGQTNTVNRGRDTTLRYKTEIRNNGPNQARLDSIKAEKTKKKK